MFSDGLPGDTTKSNVFLGGILIFLDPITDTCRESTPEGALHLLEAYSKGNVLEDVLPAGKPC
jgi:hypothetical protein